MILRIENLSKTYDQTSSGGRLEILKGIHFSVEDADSVAVVGPSGCGKSTFISLVAGLDVVSEGRIFIADTDLTSLKGEELVKFRSKNIGIIFQQFHLLSHLTAYENVRLPLEFQNRTDKDLKVKKVLEQVGLSERMKHFPYQLSRGECQRVAIARVLVGEPKIILADEPTASLDQASAQTVSDLLFNLSKEHQIALVIATHDRRLASRCHKTFALQQGQLKLEAA